MATKSRFFRVATEGATTDGRAIEKKWIQQMAKNFNPTKYGARVWLEHYRGIAPDGLFKAYGDVKALEAREVEGGKLALFAQIEPLPELVAMTKAKQKIYTSIEVNPSFADTGEAYMTGLGVTDSPASLGTDVLTRNSAIKLVDSPYDDRQWVAMPALLLDVALVHVDRADTRGVCQVNGPDVYMDDLFVRAAKQSFVSCDELVDSSYFESAEASRQVFWERAHTSGVVHVPAGAHPSSCAPSYGFDVKHFKEYAATAKEEGGWQKYAERYVNCTEGEYLERVGGIDAVRKLPLPVF